MQQDRERLVQICCAPKLPIQFGIGVTAKAPEEREKVRRILKSHNGHFINFYGEWTIAMMDP